MPVQPKVPRSPFLDREGQRCHQAHCLKGLQPASMKSKSPAPDRYRVRWNALAQGTRLGRRSPAACTITSTAKFFVRIHKTPRKRPASDVITIEYPTAINSEGCCEPRASCVAAVRR